MNALEQQVEALTEAAEKPKKMSGAQRRRLLRMPLNVTPPPEPKPRRQRARRQVVGGLWGSPEYARLRAAYRKHDRVLFEGRWWAHVKFIARDGERFRAIVQPVAPRKQPRPA